MSLEAICDLPVKEIADENAVLFLWTTSYHIFESKAVLDAWGFEYKSMFIWDKVKHNMGCYNSVRHELLLIATKGSCTPDNVELIDSVQSIERTRHSEKPEEFRKIIETLYKYGNKVECFARKQTEGWDAYGNECS
uniref:N6-adenosine-specific RNA methylase IME4 n=2 Tax=Candidatus Kentrum sp. SD TaxID=2126332 RepID=A0A451BSV2_9GAMM|nr:MAG: N6-adenosine-specific RNA methylase IME4 [Candidatus Kentron sp. SD]